MPKEQLMIYVNRYNMQITLIKNWYYHFALVHFDCKNSVFI